MQDYENKLVKAILVKPEIYSNNKEVLNLKDLFQNRYNKFLWQNIQEFHEKYSAIPTEEVLRDKIKIEVANEGQLKIVLDHLDLNITPLEIEEPELLYIEDRIKHQVKENYMRTHINKIDSYSAQELGNVIDTIQKLTTTEKRYEIINLWDEITNDEREVIPTNLELIDEFGVAKGEIGLLMAGTGVGKSVFLSFIANNFMLAGHKVLHIVFEGSKNHYLKAHRIKLNNPSTEDLKLGGKFHNLKIVKMKANQTSVKDIEDLIRSCGKDNFIPDALVIDYLDCIVINNNKDGWVNDISIINDLEHLAQKHNLAIWSAVQANRSGINRDLELSNISGSISKAQKATLILALSRNEIQEEENRADVRVLKNRTGLKRASHNCIWNPSRMQIVMPITKEVLL
jgi:replicative DNA helicase